MGNNNSTTRQSYSQKKHTNATVLGEGTRHEKHIQVKEYKLKILQNHIHMYTMAIQTIYNQSWNNNRTKRQRYSRNKHEKCHGYAYL